VEHRTLRIAMNGVTGRMGARQHLARSILAIRERGGLALPDGSTLWPEPVLVGRSEARLRELAARHGLTEWTTSLAQVLADPGIEVYFDAQVTHARAAALQAAIAAGKHVYTEKPVAGSLAEALGLASQAAAAGLTAGVVADKLFLPGMRALKRLADGGFLGRVLSVRGEFGYWVFEGGWQEPQRPSWNFRRADGGGIVLDMFPHWRYLLEGIFAPVRSVYAAAATHIPVRRDELGVPYHATADDAAYAVFELDGGIVAQVNSSWAVRVHRDELVEFQVDGTEGSAVAGLHTCRAQHRGLTPRPVWDPDTPVAASFRGQWQEVPPSAPAGNCFLAQWELFLADVAAGRPHRWDLLAGARGVQLAELGMRSAAEGRKLDVPPLEVER
jgi:predicted dehydrogenase